MRAYSTSKPPSIGYSVGALLGNEASAKKLIDFQNKQAARKRVASLFGDDFGFGYDLATAVPQVFADLGASALAIKGATAIASKLPDLGAINFLDFQKGFVNDALTSKPKTNFESASQKRIKELIKESSKDSTKVKAAISKNNEYIATKLAVPFLCLQHPPLDLVGLLTLQSIALYPMICLMRRSMIKL